jgi:hypothetical protein
MPRSVSGSTSQVWWSHVIMASCLFGLWICIRIQLLFFLIQ